ncbi:hypothetical protein COL26b_007034 [Colletotrichum chrysophilum]|uniref:LysM domain-containing protein n=1 Tax=Colletotrichum chrysophilum TaxID=1836956 RepID=A0AAD9AZ83_9PEZI|nr:uncharacterized protein COL26b_007034 [Colletotrichum chrysophilum]KAJ0374713.1 hypothetical protein COL26b_007034 [Colletotrichum chrysophilum]KAK1855400.1 LysM domain-containing protein [Colletotrichum chrysophilum]
MEPEGPLNDEDSDEDWFCGSPAFPNQYACITLRGGSWNGPPEWEIPDDGEGPVFEGPGSTPSLSILENPASPPTNMQEGIASGCNRYVQANITIASCWKITNDGGTLQARLFEVDLVVGKPGERCDTQVWLGY